MRAASKGDRDSSLISQVGSKLANDVSQLMPDGGLASSRNHGSPDRGTSLSEQNHEASIVVIRPR